ncbi:MarR family transcriptional regulator [Acidisoma cellulosilytica]|uniref:MarR family transcriptional regulator n=1 Tax=Acidisoma cellulosilyticum TaxID=2802395 RepID=A0A964E4C7_9PROT|nr:helix-turn-helix domain-containing GNAT family N-acetyltransferase [Acidisoma cellulosilyticum]MCB8881550.1 MarR family transcriptional regulator [Acidisoma cellulosilyticum]
METATAQLRRFNRFFTHYVGALDPKFLGTEMSLAEARLLFEIAQRDLPLAADLQAALGMDGGFVSRVLGRFETRGWIERERGAEDGRQRPIALTASGHAVAAELDSRQQTVVEASLQRLNPGQRAQLTQALTTVQSLLDPASERTFTLRSFRPGDMGLIASRQSILYREDYGWGPDIEVIEGEVTTNFLRNFKPGREQCWVAEVNGMIAGSVFLTDEGDDRSRLRLLYVESSARGLGIGRALVATCVDFARSTGYRDISLWTHTILETARRIYAEHGFTITETAMHDRFGMPLMGETWVLKLRP